MSSERLIAVDNDASSDSLSREALLRAASGAGEEVQKQGRRFFNGFSDFALQDNVLEVAVGLILAAAFTTLVTSFVSDILLPPLSLIPFIHKNLDEKFAVLKRGPHYQSAHGYNTAEIALADGAVIMVWGAFVNKLFNFLGMGLALYIIASVYEWLSNDTIVRHTVQCTYCRKSISTKAQRCVFCTSWQDGREERMR